MVTPYMDKGSSCTDPTDIVTTLFGIHTATCGKTTHFCRRSLLVFSPTHLLLYIKERLNHINMELCLFLKYIVHQLNPDKCVQLGQMVEGGKKITYFLASDGHFSASF